MEGYLDANATKINVNWWLKEIYSGEEDRDNKTHQSHWANWRKMYRDEWEDGVYPKNMMFIMRRSIVPRLYFRNPKISILAKKPGIAYQSLAKVMERADNTVINSMGLKKEMKRLVNRSFITSSSPLKLLYGAEHTPTPALGGTSAPVSDKGIRSEYRQGVVPNMPYLKALNMDDFVLAKDIQEFEDSFFQAHRIVRYWDDLINDPRFPIFKKHAKRGRHVVDPVGDSDTIALSDNTRRLVELYEVRDRRTRRVFIICPHYVTDQAIFIADDELQTNYSSPFYLFAPNPDDEHPYGISDARVLVPYQEQLNEINTKIYIHAKLSIAKIIAEKNAISHDEANKLLNEDIGVVIQVAKKSGIEWVQAVNDIPQGLLAEKAELLEDIREVTGFSRNSMAQFQAKSHGPTATEVNAVKGAAELRMDERRDELSDLLTAAIRDMHLIMFRHWDQEQVARVVGSDGLPVWVRFTGQMLQEGEYDIKVEPDTSVAETTEVREARAERIYDKLKLDPNVDPVKLTRHYIHEQSTVALDDLMNSNIAPEEGILSLEEFTANEASAAQNQGAVPGSNLVS